MRAVTARAFARSLESQASDVFWKQNDDGLSAAKTMIAEVPKPPKKPEVKLEVVATYCLPSATPWTSSTPAEADAGAS